MKIVITGTTGLLGFNLFNFFQSLGYEMYPAQRAERFQVSSNNTLHFDLEKVDSFFSDLEKIQPKVLIHCAALTNVDECEKNPENAFKLNSKASEDLADFCGKNHIRFIFISTDQLWDGSKSFVDEKEIPAPLNVYGKSKMKAESLILDVNPKSLIIRTNFFGEGLENNKSILNWCLKSIKNEKSISGFRDVFFTPISIPYLAFYLDKLLNLDLIGIFHLIGSERVSKLEFLRRIAIAYGYNSNLIKNISVDDQNLFAPRPKDMSLSVNKIETVLSCKMPDLNKSILSITNNKINLNECK